MFRLTDPVSKMQKVKTAISLVVIVAALAYLAVRFLGTTPKVDARPHLGLGRVLAEEAARLAGVGGRIILIAPDITVFR